VGKHLEGGDYGLNICYVSRLEIQKYVRYSITYTFSLQYDTI